MNKKIIAVILTVLMVMSAASVLSFATTVKAGDVTGDDKITAADARLVLRASAKLETLDENQLIIAEVTGDGKISAADARLILRAAAKLETLPDITLPEDSTAEPDTDETTTQEPETDETTTQEPDTDETTTQEPDTDNTVTEYPAAIDALFSGKFYMEGDISDGEQSSTVVIATDGSSTEMGMSMDGFSMSIYSTKKTLYIKFPYLNKNYYVEMDEETLKDMGAEDFDISSLTESLTFCSIDDYGKPTLSQEEIDGTEYDVYTFKSDDNSSIKFYADDNDEIKYIIIIDVNGKEGMRIKTNALSGTIPKNMLTIKGYTKGSIFTLVSAMSAFTGS